MLQAPTTTISSDRSGRPGKNLHILNTVNL